MNQPMTQQIIARFRELLSIQRGKTSDGQNITVGTAVETLKQVLEELDDE